MGKFIAGLVLGLIIGLIGILAIVYYAKGDWINFKLIVLDIADLIYKFIYAYFKYILLFIAMIIGLAGAYVLWEIADVNKYRAIKEEEIKEAYQKAKEEIKQAEQKTVEFVREKKREAESLIQSSQAKADRIIRKAKEEAEYIRNEAYEKGYQEGQEKHKKELKSLRAKVSAVKSIFKTYPELNECFKRITGWDFEKWLKER